MGHDLSACGASEEGRGGVRLWDSSSQGWHWFLQWIGRSRGITALKGRGSHSSWPATTSARATAVDRQVASFGAVPLPRKLFPLDDSALQPRWGWQLLVPATGTTVRPASSSEPQGPELLGT